MAAIQEDAVRDERDDTVNAAASKISSLMDGSPPEDETPPVENEEQTEAPVESKEEVVEEPTESEEEPVTHFAELAEHLGVEEEFLEALVIPTKINGEEREVSLKEIKAHFQKGEAADLKLMDLAEQRKTFDNEVNTAKQALQQEWSQIQNLSSELQSVIDGGNEVDESLRQSDPAEYVAQMAEKQSRLESAKKAQGELQKANSDRVMSEYQNRVQSERPKLLTAIPEWQDDKTMESENLKLRAYLKNQGLQDFEIDGKVENGQLVHPGIIDHRAIVMARKAMLYDESLKGSEPKKRKLKSLPKVGSGKPKARSDVKDDKSKAARKRARETGTERDAAAIIFDMMNQE